MTKAKAIALLNEMHSHCILRSATDAYDDALRDQKGEALMMAIEALSQESSEDVISRQAAISHVDDVPYIKDHPNVGLLWKAWIESLPSAQPEVKPIEYRDCANAMLRMWMDWRMW